jgi:hypothetical protein
MDSEKRQRLIAIGRFRNYPHVGLRIDFSRDPRHHQGMIVHCHNANELSFRHKANLRRPLPLHDTTVRTQAPGTKELFGTTPF